jgi:molybdopterin-synthase adenylyltransferase
MIVLTDRYSRQIMFKHIGEMGQEKIGQKHVLIIGCGALGSANAENLVRAGIGKLTIIDRDYVEITNLQRQNLFTEKDCDEQLPKVIAAKKRLEEINSSVCIVPHVLDANFETLCPIIERSSIDLIIDATDNFDTRFLINDISLKYNIPWIMGSCVGSMGMSFTILPGQTPCLQCLLDSLPVSGATCDSVGIVSPAVQMVTAFQSTEALKILVEDYYSLRTTLVTFDLWSNYFQTIRVERAKKEHCPTCGKQPSYPYLQYDSQTKTELLCGRNTVQIRTGKKIPIDRLAKRLKKVGQLRVNPYLLSIDYQSYRAVIFRDGRVLIHGTNSKEIAKKIYHQLIG